ncbi:hypothetical protein KIPB_015490, partial [Kipferlia bialata]
GIDMWSVGCILGEIYLGQAMFPGTSTMNQLDKIIEITGRPSAEDMQSIQSPFAHTMLESLPPSRPRPLSDIIPSAPADAIDLMQKILTFNPDKRLSCHDILRHPYLA